MKDFAGRLSALTPQQRAVLEARLQKRISDSPAPQTIRMRDSKSAPMSIDQERIWFLEQLQPGNSAYNVHRTRELRMTPNLAVLERSVNEIIRRHEVLRTTIDVTDGVPVQIITPELSIRIPIVDISLLPPDARRTKALQLLKEAGNRVFDLAKGPLLYVSLLQLAEQDYVLIMTMHHIVMDRWSFDVFEQELATLYQAYSLGQPSPLPELPMQFADFTRWQREWLEGKECQNQLSYWKRQLAGVPPMLDIPIDFPRPAMQTYAGANEDILLSEALSQELKDLCRREGVTMFMLLLAAYNVLLYRHSGQDDILIGAPMVNRPLPESEKLIGYMLNMLVLRVDLSGNVSFRELLKRVREVCNEAYAHQDLPFGTLIDELNPLRQLDRNPLYQAAFIFLDFPDFTAGGFFRQIIRPLEVDSGISRLDLTLSLNQTREVIIGFFEYNRDLFKAETIKLFAKHLETLLESIVANPEGRIAELPMLTEQERFRFLSEWNDTRPDLLPGSCIHHLFEQQVELTPDATALTFEDQNLTYRELNRQANQLAHYLRGLGVGAESIVGIFVERGIALAVTIIGTLKAGGAYVPLDPAYPRERLAFIMDTATVCVVLTEQSLVAQLPRSKAEVVCLDEVRESLLSQPVENPSGGVGPDNLAYVIYTSGSTGVPKGVMIEHKNVTHLFRNVRQLYDFQENETWSLFHSYAFDVSVWELWGALLHGGRLVIVPQSAIRAPDSFFDLLKKEHVTILSQTRTALMNLTSSVTKFPDLCRELSLSSLNIGGEAFPQEITDDLAGVNTEVWNFYGPTETTVWVAMHRVRQGEKPVPLGRPFAHTQLYILNEQLQPVPVGVNGELYIGGGGLARGYYNQPEMTAEKFIPHPYSLEEGARLYRTGDIVRYLPDGKLVFIERADRQVKVRGFRIELGEVETVLAQHVSVRDAAVVTANDDTGGQQLVAYIVPQQERAFAISELRTFLREMLPEYMIPSLFIKLDALPLTATGKPDRRALPVSHQMQEEFPHGSTAARTPVEEMLVEIWEEVLRVPQAGIYDNFFELGGHSLRATQVMSRLREVFQIDVPLRLLFEKPTVAGLAESITQTMKGEHAAPPPPIVSTNFEGLPPLSFAQQRMWISSQLEPDDPFYNIATKIDFKGRLDVTALSRSLQEIVRRHEVLRTTFDTIYGQLFQVISPFSEIKLPVIDISALGESVREREALRLADDEARTAVDLGRGPILRVLLLRIAEDEHALLATIHHIAFDGWSIGVFVRELIAHYTAFSQGEDSLLPLLPIQYKDYALWQKQLIDGEMLSEQMRYWKQQLEGILPHLELPTDRPRSAAQPFTIGYQYFILPAELSQALKKLSQQKSVSLFMTFLAAFKTLLYRLTQQDDIIVGTAIAGRNRREMEVLIGCFVNMLALRTDLSGNPSFSEVLKQVRDVALGAYAHQDLPFEELINHLRVSGNTKQPWQIQVACGMWNAPTEKLDLPGLTTSSVIFENDAMRVDLILWLVDTEQGLNVKWKYNAELFEPATIQRLHTCLLTLLHSIVSDPETKIDKLEILSKDERRQQILSEQEREADWLNKFTASKRKAISFKTQSKVS